MLQFLAIPLKPDAGWDVRVVRIGQALYEETIAR
jgi:hypothetical protein